MIPTPLVRASPLPAAAPCCAGGRPQALRAASCAPGKKRSLPLAFLAGYPLNSMVFHLGWVTENRQYVRLQLVWPVSCVVTSPISAFHPKTLKEVHALGRLRSGHFFYSHEAKDQRKEGRVLSVAIMPPLLESALASSALGQSLPTWLPCWLPPLME